MNNYEKRIKVFFSFSIAILVAVTGMLTGCGKHNTEHTGASSTDRVQVAKPTIKVGSKDFTESLVLGEIYALALENAGYKVERKFNLREVQLSILP